MNYYAYKAPKIENKYALIESIINDNPINIQDCYREYIVNNLIHLGKKSAGWRFIWNPHYSLCGNDVEFPYYEPTKSSIENFLFNSGEYIAIFDEDGKQILGSLFLKLAFDSEGLTTTEYYKGISSQIQSNYDQGILNHVTDAITDKINLSVGNFEFSNDGLIFSSTTEFN